MKPLEEILANINKSVSDYETKKLSFTQEQSEILRDLSVNLHWLAEHRIIYHEQWLGIYFETSGSNASKEREADFRIPELYKIRHFMSSGYKVLDSLRSTISANKSN